MINKKLLDMNEIRPKISSKCNEQSTVPHGWKESPLNNFSEIVMGQSPAGNTYNQNEVGMPLINGPTEFKEKFPIKIQWTTNPTKLCINNDILLCIRGSSTGRINIANDEYCIGRGIAAIRAKDNADNLFLRYKVQSIVDEILALTSGSTFPNIDGKTLRGIKTLLPPLPEQKAIAQALSDVDNLISALDALIEKKRNIKQGTMQELLTGNRRLPGFSGEWQKITFADLADISVQWSITGGPFGSNLKTSDYTSEGVRIIQLQNIGDGVFNDDYKIFTSEQKANELINCNIYPSDIVLSKMGDPVARACLVPNTNERYLMASDGIRLVVNQNKFNKYFILEYINSKYFRQQAVEASTGTTRQRIGLQDLKKLKLFTPTLDEQNAIAQILSDMDNETKKLEQQRNKTKLLKQGMMQELLTGKMRLI